MAAECCSSCEYQRTVGYPSTSWASCYFIETIMQEGLNPIYYLYAQAE